MARDTFEARDYWEKRLADDYSLTGVGFRRLGPSFNAWAYRVRRERFLFAVQRLELDPDNAQVVDVGSGTGVYVDCWQSLGASVTGVDLTEVAVQQLRQAFPDGRFVRSDISEPGLVELIGAESADAVSAMDVLFTSWRAPPSRMLCATSTPYSALAATSSIPICSSTVGRGAGSTESLARS